MSYETRPSLHRASYAGLVMLMMGFAVEAAAYWETGEKAAPTLNVYSDTISDEVFESIVGGKRSIVMPHIPWEARCPGAYLRLYRRNALTCGVLPTNRDVIVARITGSYSDARLYGDQTLVVFEPLPMGALEPPVFIAISVDPSPILQGLEEARSGVLAKMGTPHVGFPEPEKPDYTGQISAVQLGNARIEYGQSAEEKPAPAEGKAMPAEVGLSLYKDGVIHLTAKDVGTLRNGDAILPPGADTSSFLPRVGDEVIGPDGDKYVCTSAKGMKESGSYLDPDGFVFQTESDRAVKIHRSGRELLRQPLQYARMAMPRVKAEGVS